MDAADDVGTGQDQEVIVALDVHRPVGEALAAEVLLAQDMALDHRPHGAVEHQDSLGQQPLEGGQPLGPAVGGGEGGVVLRHAWSGSFRDTKNTRGERRPPGSDLAFV